MKALAVTLATVAGTVFLAGSAAALPAVGTLSVSDAQMAEGTFGTRPLTFSVTLSESSSSPVSVRYRTQNETARAGEDYVSTQGTLQFASGETTKTIEVLVNGDRAVEPDEFFSVILSEPVNAPVAQPGGVGTGTIRNDDVSAVLCRCRSVKLRVARTAERATFREIVVKAAMTCRTGDASDCAGFVKTVSPSATQKPTPFTCRAKKCASITTYTLRVRVGVTQKKLRMRSGCRGSRGELRTFALTPSK